MLPRVLCSHISKGQSHLTVLRVTLISTPQIRHPLFSLPDVSRRTYSTCPHLACLPDRRVYDPIEANPWRTLEIKFPLSDSVVERPYLKEVNGTLKLKKSHACYYQVCGPLLLSETEWVDFFVMCNDDYHLERIRSDSEMLVNNERKLDQFYFEHFLPSLMKS